MKLVMKEKNIQYIKLHIMRVELKEVDVHVQVLTKLPIITRDLTNRIILKNLMTEL